MSGERLPPETFEIPYAEIRRGYRSAIYFNRSKEVARLDPERDSMGVTMQVFQKNNAVLCGIDEAIAILRTCAGHWKDEKSAAVLFDGYMDAKLRTRSMDHKIRQQAFRELLNYEELLDQMWVSGWDLLEVEALYDGYEIEPWEPVLRIKGPYSAFAHLESVYLGVLSRATKVASNTARVTTAARGKPVLFFADRFDRWSNQGADGYASYIGGATGFASDAMGAWWGESGMGTMPHALIAFYGGSTLNACRAFHFRYPDVPLIPLVDYSNNCVGTSLAALKEFGDALYGVRLDTSENMVDQSISGQWRQQMGDFKPTGVNPVLVSNVRKALDEEGGEHVKVVASGGFNDTKISQFEDLGVPVDVYAVGESLLLGSNSFTADVVSPSSKEGRWFHHSDRLEAVA